MRNNIKTLFPEIGQFALLKKLGGVVIVLRSKNRASSNSAVFVVGRQGELIKINIEYRYIVPKFENFSLWISEKNLGDVHGGVFKEAEISMWDTIVCCFQYVWERKMIDAEVESSLIEHGARDDVPESILAGGVSLAGLAFLDSKTRVFKYLMYHVFDEAAEIRSTNDQNIINEFTSACDLVELDKVNEWINGGATH